MSSKWWGDGVRKQGEENNLNKKGMRGRRGWPTGLTRDTPEMERSGVSVKACWGGKGEKESGRGAAITCRSGGKARQWSGRCLGGGGEAHRERSETLATEPEPKKRRAEQSAFPPDGRANLGRGVSAAGFEEWSQGQDGSGTEAKDAALRTRGVFSLAWKFLKP